MMVLRLGQLADAVHERERVGEVVEPELALQGAVGLAPAPGRAHAGQYDWRDPPRVGEFSIRALVEEGAGSELELHGRTINPQFLRMLRTIGFDRHWSRGE